MSLTLGEKLREAREAKGIKIGEVAEQTRISPLYIESIENDDYRALPGGIFNRGFVKSFAKYVGVDEQEALSDYARLLHETEGNVENVKFYRPEVLTDDRGPSSMLPTLIIAAVILGIMTVGVLFVLRQFQSGEPSANLADSRTNTNSTDAHSAAEVETPRTESSTTPDFGTLVVEFRAVNQPVALTATTDGTTTSKTITPGAAMTFEPKGSIKFSYSRWVSEFAQLEINGKNIILPKAPLNPKRGTIEFEINKENLGAIWNSGEITNDAPPPIRAVNANSGSPGIGATPPVQTIAVPPMPGTSQNSAQRQPSGNRIIGTSKPSGTARSPVPARPQGNIR